MKSTVDHFIKQFRRCLAIANVQNKIKNDSSDFCFCMEEFQKQEKKPKRFFKNLIFNSRILISVIDLH